MIRRSLTPSIGTPAPGLPPTRRAGGARRTVSYRLAFFRGPTEMPGWALNLSRGGLRAVIEDRVDLGEDLEVQIEEIQVKKRGKIVWVQDEPDGAIIGFAFDAPIDTAPPGVDLETTLTVPGQVANELGVALGNPAGVPQTPPEVPLAGPAGVPQTPSGEPGSGDTGGSR